MGNLAHFRQMKTIQSRTFLASKYGLCRQTITKILALHGITHRGHLTPLDIEILVTKYGSPELLKQMAERLKG